MLPCGNTACFQCISKGIKENHKFKCEFEKCESLHEITDVNKLVTNILAEEALHDNLCLIAEEFYAKIKETFLNLKGMSFFISKWTSVFFDSNAPPQFYPISEIVYERSKSLTLNDDVKDYERFVSDH